MITEQKTLLAILCVDAVDNDVPAGRFYHGDLHCEYDFLSMDQFLLTADKILAGRDSNIPARERENAAVWLPGKIATFRIQIKFCRNESWQGSVLWLETRHEEQFRSEMELMSIIHQALIPAQRQRMCPSGLKVVR